MSARCVLHARAFPAVLALLVVCVPPLRRAAAAMDNAGLGAGPWAAEEPPHHPSRVIVKFKKGKARAKAASLAAKEALRLYKENPDVESVEFDYEVRLFDTVPADPKWAEQWDIAAIQASQAWDSQTDASDVVVAVLDTGIDFTPPDLQGNLWTGTDGSHGYDCINIPSDASSSFQVQTAENEGSEAESRKAGEIYAYPNPASGGKATIHAEFGLAEGLDVSIYDLTGGGLVHSGSVAGPPTLINGRYAYEYAWNLGAIAPGVYAYRLAARKSGEKLNASGRVAIVK